VNVQIHIENFPHGDCIINGSWHDDFEVWAKGFVSHFNLTDMRTNTQLHMYRNSHGNFEIVPPGNMPG